MGELERHRVDDGEETLTYIGQTLSHEGGRSRPPTNLEQGEALCAGERN